MGNKESSSAPRSSDDTGQCGLVHVRSKPPATVAHDQISGGEESRAAAASVPSAHANTSVSSSAPGPLPSSQIHLHLPAGDAPAATTGSSSTSALPTSAGSADHDDSLPDAIILPSAPVSVSTAAHQAAASESHHLLNVHVDGAETKAGNAAAAPASASSATATTTGSVAAVASATHSSSLEPSSSASTSGASTTAAGDDDDSLAELEDAVEEAGISSGSAEDREARRAARHREREARKREREAAAEKKRLMSMSALERQFGQTDVKKPAKPAASAPVVARATGTALTPGDQSHSLSLPVVADADTLDLVGSSAVGAAATATSTQPAPPSSSSSASSSSSSSPPSTALSPAGNCVFRRRWRHCRRINCKLQAMTSTTK